MEFFIALFRHFLWAETSAWIAFWGCITIIVLASFVTAIILELLAVLKIILGG